MVRARAPLRIDLAGGWTDVPAFAQREGGAVVNGAITLYARVDFLPGGERIRLHAEDLGEHVTLPTPSAIAYNGRLDLHKAALNMLPVTGGIEILSRCDAPAGSGLGASGALDVALLAGLAHLRQEQFDREELAEMGFFLETSELQLLGGRQDQYAAALGGFHEFEFRDDRVQCRRLTIAEDAARDLERHLILVYTGESHFSSATHQRVWEAYAGESPVVVESLQIMRALSGEARAALTDGNWEALARVVDGNWRQQQRLDRTVSTAATQRIEGAVRKAGAWGVKATGAGAGGCLIVVCSPDERQHVGEAAMEEGATLLPFTFDFGGVEVWQEDHADDA